MRGFVNRRALLAMAGAMMIAGCGGTREYQDQGPGNLELRMTSNEGGFLTQRNVFLDVWTGPKGANMEYLGTRKFAKGGNMVGLPTGRHLHLALAFEEGGFLMGHQGTDTIEIPMKPLRKGERWRLTVAFDDLGFDWDMKRIR